MSGPLHRSARGPALAAVLCALLAPAHAQQTTTTAYDLDGDGEIDVIESTTITGADLNGDGRQDVVLPIDGTFKLFLNEGPENLLRAVTDGMTVRPPTSTARTP